MGKDDLAPAALAGWASAIDVESVSPMPRVTNPLWRVRTSNGQRLVLKMLPEYPPGASRVDEFRVLCHLQARGVPVALPLLTDDPAKVLSEALPALPDEAILPVGPLVDRLRAAVSDLPTQLTHGDCNTGNVLVDGGRVSGFLDFDHLPIGPRVRDLSYYLASRLGTHLSEQRTVAESVPAFQGVLELSGGACAPGRRRPDAGP